MAETLAIALLTYAGVAATTVNVAVTAAAIGAALAAGLSFLAQAFMAATASTEPSKRQEIVRAPVAPRTRTYGRARVAGTQVFLGTKNQKLYRVLAMSDGQIDGVEEHIHGDRVLTLGASGNVTSPSLLTPTVNVYWREGSDNQSIYSQLSAAFPEWDSTCKGNAVHHSLTVWGRGGQDDFLSRYPGGPNTVFKQTIRGARLWDPRDGAQDAEDASTWEWTDNAALVALDYLRHHSGMAVSLDWITPELDAWIAAADECDEAVPLAAGGAEVRYRAWGTYDYQERPAEVLGRILTACNGRLGMGVNGGLSLTVGAWTEPTVTLDDTAIVSYSIGSGNEAPETANTLTATYTDGPQGYVENEAEPWIDEDAVAAFGTQRGDARLYMVPSHGQCRRLMKQAFHRLAPEWRGTITTNLAGLPALSERFVRIQISEADLDITAEIDDVQFRIEDGSVVTGLVISWVAISAAAFAWDPEAEEGTPSGIAPELDPDAVPLPAELNVTMHTGVVAIATHNTADDSNAFKIRLQRRTPPTIGGWVDTLSTAGATSVTTPTLTGGAAYEFRARHERVSPAKNGEWSDIVTRTATVDTTAPGVPTGLTTTLSGASVFVAWVNPAGANIYGARLYRHTSNVPASATLVTTRYAGGGVAQALEDAPAAGTYWWWVAALNENGVESARTLAGTETIP